MKLPYTRADGSVLKPGNWIKVDKGVGKFSGTWENPTLGKMASLVFYRSFLEPSDVDTLWLNLPTCAHVLDAAVRVEGPMGANGAQPKETTERPKLAVIEGGRA